MNRHSPHRLAAGTAVALTAALVLSACGSAPENAGPAVALAPAAPTKILSGVCPAQVDVQLQWQPQSDMGGVFGLLGPGYAVDTDAKTVTGPLVAQGKDTGVRISLHAGGSAIGFQSVPSRMYLDDTIELGLVHGDQLVSSAARQRVIGVTPLLKYSPAILMWDPATHPGWKSVADIGRSGVTVVVSQDQIFPQWLVSRGMLSQRQLDTSYSGAPARFVADPTIAQQGFANAEPFTYQHDTPAWDRPVEYELLRDVGYDVYDSNVTVRADRLAALAPCLRKLVPIIQRADADYVTDPGPVNAVIVDVVSRTQSFTPYSADEAAYSARLLKDQGLIANEADGSIGTYDEARVQRTVDELVPILNASGAGLSALKASDLVTNQFVDRSIGIR
jgi:hypothetical protein